MCDVGAGGGVAGWCGVFSTGLLKAVAGTVLDMDPSEGERVTVLSDLGDALEGVVFTDRYRWFVRVLLAVVAVLGSIHLLRVAAGDLLGLSSGAARLLELATSLALTAFVVAGALQLLLFSRGVRRREAMVAKSAEDVERSADDVTRAAEELDRAIDEPERIEADPEEIESQVERAEEQATGAKETAEQVRDELDPPGELDGTGRRDDPED